MTDPQYTCRVCGETHEGIPQSFAADFPDMYADMSEADRENRVVIGSDQCIVDEQWFFVCGCLEIPITGTNDVLLWGLWVSVKEDVFDAISASWERVGREEHVGPFKARLANRLSVYPETLNLKVKIQIRPVGERPLFVVEEEHVLAANQMDGISRREALDLSASLLHQLPN